MSKKKCPNEFKCDNCGGVFHQAWTDKDAFAEMRSNFPGLKPENAVRVCDECYQRILRDLPASLRKWVLAAV